MEATNVPEGYRSVSDCTETPKGCRNDSDRTLVIVLVSMFFPSYPLKFLSAFSSCSRLPMSYHFLSVTYA